MGTAEELRPLGECFGVSAEKILEALAAPSDENMKLIKGLAAFNNPDFACPSGIPKPTPPATGPSPTPFEDDDEDVDGKRELEMALIQLLKKDIEEDENDRQGDRKADRKADREADRKADRKEGRKGDKKPEDDDFLPTGLPDFTLPDFGFGEKREMGEEKAQRRPKGERK